MKKKIVTFCLLLFMAVSFSSCFVREHGHEHHHGHEHGEHHEHHEHHEMR